MTSLRHRLLRDPESKFSKRDESPPEAEEVRLVPVSKIKTDKDNPKSRKKRNGLIFFLGGLFGIVAAGFFAQKSDLIEFDFPELGEITMDSIMDVLPAGFVKDAKDLAVSYSVYMVDVKLHANYPNRGVRGRQRIMIVSKWA